MRLRIIQSREGDSLVLTQDAATAAGAQWTHVMIDAGRSAAYEQSMRTALSALERSHDEPDQPTIDLVVVSHIDRDHIEGVLRYADDLVEWKVHDHQLQQAAADDTLASNLTPPSFERPPMPGEVWHNSFDNLLDQDGGDGLSSRVSDVIAALTARFDPPADLETTDIVPGSSAAAAAAGVYGLEAGERQAHHLTARLSPEQLNVSMNGPIDDPPGGHLMRVGSVTSPVHVGSLRFTLLGPTQTELDELEAEWIEWLTTAQAALEEVADRSSEIEHDLGHPELDAVAGQLSAERAPLTAADLLRDLALAAGEGLEAATTLGRAGKVTWPNRASLMLLAEAGEGAQLRRIVLTGDGHHTRILTGLEQAGVLPAGGNAHVDVLKIPHHGSEHNADETFFRRVIADHYVICGDGSHHNPDLAILDALFKSRLGDATQRSTHAQAGDFFTLWFSTAPGHPSLVTRNTARGHIEVVKAKVDQLLVDHPNTFGAQWSNSHFIDLDLPIAGAAPGGGRVFISRALPNPAGGDAGNEWVELTNDGAATASLVGLQLQDRQGGSLDLAGSLGAGETRRIVLPGGGPIRLSNAGDDVNLMRGADVLHHVTWGTVASGQEISFLAP